MNVRNCKKCGKLFNYVSGAPVCPACKDALEKKFQEVKNMYRIIKALRFMMCQKTARWIHSRCASGCVRNVWSSAATAV